MKLTDAEREVILRLLDKEIEVQHSILEHGVLAHMQTPYYFEKNIERIRHVGCVRVLKSKVEGG